jgi:multidrug efflux pump subunit AcrA (membrane-fusion protein)
VSAVHTGLRATFGAEALGEHTAAGQITMVNQAVDPARRTVEVWAELPNREGTLRDGVFGHLTIVTERRPRRVLIPRAAVLLEPGSLAGTVMVVDDHKVAHKRAVQTLGGTGERVGIASGLTAGETVVVEAGYGLPDNTAVRLQGEADEARAEK